MANEKREFFDITEFTGGEGDIVPVKRGSLTQHKGEQKGALLGQFVRDYAFSYPAAWLATVLQATNIIPGSPEEAVESTAPGALELIDGLVANREARRAVRLLPKAEQAEIGKRILGDDYNRIFGGLLRVRQRDTSQEIQPDEVRIAANLAAEFLENQGDNMNVQERIAEEIHGVLTSILADIGVQATQHEIDRSIRDLLGDEQVLMDLNLGKTLTAQLLAGVFEIQEIVGAITGGNKLILDTRGSDAILKLQRGGEIAVIAEANMLDTNVLARNVLEIAAKRSRKKKENPGPSRKFIQNLWKKLTGDDLKFNVLPLGGVLEMGSRQSGERHELAVLDATETAGLLSLVASLVDKAIDRRDQAKPPEIVRQEAVEGAKQKMVFEVPRANKIFGKVRDLLEGDIDIDAQPDQDQPKETPPPKRKELEALPAPSPARLTMPSIEQAVQFLENKDQFRQAFQAKWGDEKGQQAFEKAYNKVKQVIKKNAYQQS